LWFAFSVRPAIAQQRPLVTEDPESIGAGRILLEGGFDLFHGQPFPASGLEGNFLRLPSLGISLGLSSIAELQVDGGYDRLSISRRREGPLDGLVTVTTASASTWEDMFIATKIRVAPEAPGRPGFGVRIATKLPMASVGSGLGLDTTDFYTALLIGKTTRSVRVVGNIGFGMLTNPTNGSDHDNVMTYGLSIARAVTNHAELVGELNGRDNLGGAETPAPGTESRATMRVGTRFTQGTVRLDGAVIFGFTSRDPSIGMTAGVTYVFNAFRVP
jgi:hypothetical protein